MSPPPLLPSQSTIATAIHHDTANIIIVTPQQPPPQPPPVHHSTTTPSLLPRIIPPWWLSHPWQQSSPHQQERGCLFGRSAAGVFGSDLLNKECLFLGLLTARGVWLVVLRQQLGCLFRGQQPKKKGGCF
nr:hypothetical protein [Tanacetum cinerariifolium]